MATAEETWNLFLKGNHEAFNDLYNQHYLGLINFGIKMTGDRIKANECLVEMLLGLWEKRERLPEVTHVRSYLLTCVRMVILKKIKAEKLREFKEESAFSESSQYDISYEDYITRIQSDTQLKNRLSRSLGKLSARQRELLKLKFFDGLNYDEIAHQCQISKRTAYNIVHESLKVLREELQRDGQGHINQLIGLLSLMPAILLLK